jgi:hypothetical protein
MSLREALQIILRARREGVTLFIQVDGKLGWKAAQRPPDGLLAVLKEHKADILALLPQPPGDDSAGVAERAERMIERLQALGFTASIDPKGALLIADALGMRRDVSQRLPIGEAFNTLVAGLAEDSGLLDPYPDPSKGGCK